MSTFSEAFDRGDYPLLPETDVCRTCEFYARANDHMETLTGNAKRDRKAFLYRMNRVHIRVDHKTKASRSHT